MAMKPMLQFTNLPPRAQDRPRRRRRRKIISPENPKVRCVSLAGLFNQANACEREEEGDGEDMPVMTDVKWVRGAG